MRIDFRNNVREVERGLSDFARREVPSALAEALNKTLANVHRDAVANLDRRLDRPVAFTRKAFALRRAYPRRLAAALFAKDVQAGYLRFQESGGTRPPKDRANVVPSAGMRLNRYGNMPRGAVARALARPDTFSGDPAGPRGGGIYRRTKRGLRLVAHYARAVAYRPRLRFEEGARRTAEARMPPAFAAALAAAIRAARRR